MARMLTTPQRFAKARALIEEARRVPVPEEGGRFDLSYVARVRGLLHDARDLVKFLSYSVGASPETKAAVKELFAETERVQAELLKK